MCDECAKLKNRITSLQLSNLSLKAQVVKYKNISEGAKTDLKCMKQMMDEDILNRSVYSKEH